MASGAADGEHPHIVVLSFVLQGHINPLMQLAKVLACRGSEVTFVLSENAAAKSSSGSALHNLRVVGLPDNLPPERSAGSSFRDAFDSMINIETSVSHFLRDLQPPASTIIYDAFMLWAPSIAQTLSIPCICFVTTNASCTILFHQVPSLLKRGVLPFRQDGEADVTLPTERVTGLMGLPDLLPEDFHYSLRMECTHFRYKFVLDICAKIHEASAVMINTMEDLESQAIRALKACKRVFTVGPLLLLSGGPSRVDMKYWQDDDRCLAWLDTQAPSSVLYVAFGSVASMTVVQFQELMLGLDSSKRPFLLVVRADAMGVPLEDALPDGFQERTKDRGMIISWGPQLLILSHPAIGGFFTHGGWNSIIENLSLRSVPTICWPHVAEQSLNRHLMVEEWKIGMRLQHAADGSVSREEIERVVNDLFHGDHAMDLKDAANKAGDMTKIAAAEEGSSQKSLDDLFNLLSL